MKILIRRVKTEPGQCYTNCWYAMLANARGPHRWVMVQGVVTGRITIEGQRIGHCWMETTHEGQEWVYEPHHHALVPKEVYYERAAPTCLHRYTAVEMVLEALKHDAVGAWTEDVSDALHTDDT